ncbi:hypothetical protein [Agrococcus casei]|uniref:hypothetical protein n=1 Tax=Agrococcus casei TaxID=343512 RepID=UPI003F93DD8B
MAIKDVRIKLNSSGIVRLLQSPEVSRELEARGTRIATAAGNKHDVNATVNRDRAVVFVTTKDTAARKAEAEQRRLSKAIDAGR